MTIRNAWQLLLVACAATVGCDEKIDAFFAPLEAAAPTTGSLEGQVTAGGQGTAATIQLTGPSPRTGMADGIGNFTFSGLNPGDYGVAATATGFQCGTRTATVVAGQTAQADVTCTPLQATIIVTVTSQGSPVSGATVSLTGPTPGTGVTGANGTVTFTNRQPGAYGASAQLDGLVCSPTTFNATGGATVNPTVTCSPLGVSVLSGDDQEGEIQVPLVAPFVAQLVANNQPVAQAGRNVTFVVETGSGQLSSATGTTDAQGRVQTLLTPGTTPGPISVRASLSGSQPGSMTAQFDALAHRGPPISELLGSFLGTGTATVNQCSLPPFSTFSPTILAGPSPNGLIWRSTLDLIAQYMRTPGSFTAEASITSGNTQFTEAVTGMFSRIAPPSNMRPRFVGQLTFRQRDLMTGAECATTYNITALHQ